MAACTLAGSASAQDRISTSFDAGYGPISGSTRFVGLGGAFVAIAEDTEGVAINPASDAVRLPYSWRRFDYGLGVDVAINALLPKKDDANRSSGNSGTALFGSLAAVFNYDHLGFGLAAEAQNNAATREDQAQGIAPTQLAANFGVVHAGVAYGYLDGQLLIGAGPRIIGASLGSGSSSGLFSAGGVGYEAGVIVKPTHSQYRVAAAVKSPIDANVPGSSNTVHVPWEMAFGAAYQFGARPLNPKFVTVDQVAHPVDGEPTSAELDAAEDELFRRYQERQRFYLLVSAQLSAFQGGTLLTADRVYEGRADPILSPRLGLESEVIPHILRLRAGTYYEPARTERTEARVHGTGGFDVRLFKWSVFGLIKRFNYWKLSVGGDAASSYLSTSFTIGFWH